MADSYGTLLPTRAIYNNPSRFMPYLILLVASKFFRSLGIFLSYDLLKLVHIVPFLFFIKAGASVLLIFLQKPFSSGKPVSKNQWFRICRHALFGCVIQLLWLFGLTLCGPLRALLLYEHGDLVILAGAAALFSQNSTPSKLRGAVFFLLAVMGILLFDHDDLEAHMQDHPEIHRHSSVLTHLFDHLTHLTGLSDHKGGVVLLFITLCMHVGYNSAAKKLSLDVGGAKRLNALSTMVSTSMLLPWTVFVFATKEMAVVSWMSMFFPMLLVTLLVFVIDYYVEAVSVSHLDGPHTCRVGSMAVFISGLILSCFWNHPFISRLTTMAQLRDVIHEDHVLSGGVVFSFVLFMFATHILTAPAKGSGTKGSFVGYSAAGVPLYSFPGDALHQVSQSALMVAKNGMRQILDESDSRKLFYFLLLNLTFTFVELIYGVWTNSLGLISDGFHMLFDCSALVMGLYAALMSRWKPTRIFSYGFDRVEILSGFINSLFLMVIAFFVFSAALARLVDPPEIRTERLLAVSLAGLLVNLVGILAFRHGHSHGGMSHGHSHGSSGHSHASHGHSHAGGQGAQGHSPMTHNTNLEGVFLHILADTLGSVGVLISTLLIERFGWKIADPICSLFIAILIFLSVLPLVKETCLILLLRTPDNLHDGLAAALQKLLSVEGIISYREEHFWRHSSKVICGTIHVQISPDISEQKLVAQVTSLFKELGVNNLAVQVEKETYFQHLSGLGVCMDNVYAMAKNLKTLNHEHTVDFIKAI